VSHVRTAVVRHRRARAVIAWVLLLAGASACGSGDDGGPVADVPSETIATIEVTSDAFAEGEPIPAEHTCDGADTMPTLSWSTPPDGTVSHVVIVDDPDAPGGTFTHWMVADIPADQHSIDGGVPGDARVGENDFRTTNWRGPCPPPDDDTHRYRFTIVALDTRLNLRRGFSPNDLADAMADHILGKGTLTGTFDR
jgi:Raf kinase inhibitor-like YbhB/YbcL family protein